MPKRIKHGGQLVHQSMAVMRKHKKLFIFPILSTLLHVLLLSGMLAPFIRHEKSMELVKHGHLHNIGWLYLIVLLALFVMHQILLYFNSALTRCTQQYFDGEKPSLRAGIKTANHSFFKFYLWNNFAGTVGLFFTLFQIPLRKLAFHKKLFQGLRWRQATYLATPVIVTDHTGPINTIKRSASLMRKTWGTNLRTNFGLLSLLVIARLLALIPTLIGLAAGGAKNILIGGAITFGIILIISAIQSATIAVLCSALHLYASTGLVPRGFSEALMKIAFREVKQYDSEEG